jgi:hypothetical protein
MPTRPEKAAREEKAQAPGAQKCIREETVGGGEKTPCVLNPGGSAGDLDVKSKPRPFPKRMQERRDLLSGQNRRHPPLRLLYPHCQSLYPGITENSQWIRLRQSNRSCSLVPYRPSIRAPVSCTATSLDHASRHEHLALSSNLSSGQFWGCTEPKSPIHTLCAQI